MGAPAGHPFFGNKYTDGGYKRGTYTYVLEKGKEIIKPYLKEARKAVTHVAPKQKLDNLIPKKFISKVSFDDIFFGCIILGSIVRVINDEIQRNKENNIEDSLLSIELQNVGTCTHCGEPLVDSVYVQEGEVDGHNAYIMCKKCGKKNFARYTDENDSEASNSDE